MPAHEVVPRSSGVRIREYERDGHVFDVVDAGPTDGEVVVLLHGFPQRARSWDGVAARLHEAGYRTLAPDQRGYSPRARPTRRRDYRLDELVADVAALIDLVGGDVHLVGHDWGAAVAWPLAARHPRVRTLTSVSVPHPAAYLLSTLTPQQARRSWYVGFFQVPWLPERSARSGRLERQLAATGMTERELETFRRDIVEHGALPGGLAWYRAIPHSLPRAAGLWREKVRVPVTHVWSDGDEALARRTADLAPRWATGEFTLRVLDGCSHWLPEQEPEVLADVILSRLRTGPAHQSS